MKRIVYILLALASCAFMACAGHPAVKDTVAPYVPAYDLSGVTLPKPDVYNLPAWHGFNKLNLFHLNSGVGYDDGGMDIREADFALMQQMGFNFVRFPMDYRYFYNPSKRSFDMEKIAWIDHAIDYGIKYNVHVELCLHTAPGYSVAPDLKDGMDLLTTGRRHFIAIWQFLANRYKDIPNSVLNFNLLNEPEPTMVFDYTGVAMNPQFASLMKDTINAVRAVTPDRLIVLDANQRHPMDLFALGVSTNNIIQSTHCYMPFSVTHEGMENQSQFPANFTDKTVTWPITNYFNGFVYATWPSSHLFGVENTKAVFNNPSGFAAGTVSMIIVRQSHDNEELALLCDGKEVARRTASKSDSPVTVTFPANAVPAGTKKVELYVSSGDWVNVDKFVISGVTVKCTNIDWALPPSSMTVGVDTVTDAQTIKDWMLPAAWDGVPVMIGEMGCMAQNPDQAAYRAILMKDYVDAFDGLPWAFWEFKGGAMSLFRLSKADVCDTPVVVHYGDGKTQTYYYDKLWYDAIKHTLDIPADGNAQ